MRLVLHCHSCAGRALPAPDKGPLRVSHKSQMVPTVTPLISHTEGDTECVRGREREGEYGDDGLEYEHYMVKDEDENFSIKKKKEH